MNTKAKLTYAQTLALEGLTPVEWGVIWEALTQYVDNTEPQEGGDYVKRHAALRLRTRFDGAISLMAKGEKS